MANFYQRQIGTTEPAHEQRTAYEAWQAMRDGCGPIYVVPETSTFDGPDQSDLDFFVVEDQLEDRLAGLVTEASEHLHIVVETFDGDPLGAFSDGWHALSFAALMADRVEAEKSTQA
jgi:hypothetical protein